MQPSPAECPDATRVSRPLSGRFVDSSTAVPVQDGLLGLVTHIDLQFLRPEVESLHLVHHLLAVHPTADHIQAHIRILGEDLHDPPDCYLEQAGFGIVGAWNLGELFASAQACAGSVTACEQYYGNLAYKYGYVGCAVSGSCVLGPTASCGFSTQGR